VSGQHPDAGDRAEAASAPETTAPHANPQATVPDQLRLRLYVAASAPNSTHAQANLRALLASAGAQDASVEVVDCIREPQRALRDGVLVTPTLLKLGPLPTCTIVGALSDAAAVALALGLGRALSSGPPLG
jgi:circadian clock protein KaiB